MLFSVNRETRKVIIVIRDLPSLIAVNCAHDTPPPPPPYGPSKLDQIAARNIGISLDKPIAFSKYM